MMIRNAKVDVEPAREQSRSLAPHHRGVSHLQIIFQDQATMHATQHAVGIR